MTDLSLISVFDLDLPVERSIHSRSEEQRREARGAHG